MAKKNKILVIDSCSHCPYYDNFYYDYVKRCELINKVIQIGKPLLFKDFDIQTDVYGTPPDECPLQDTEETPIDTNKLTRKV